MVSVIRCWKAEYQKCKHSILLYMHSLIPIMCAAIFAGYYLKLRTPRNPNFLIENPK